MSYKSDLVCKQALAQSHLIYHFSILGPSSYLAPQLPVNRGLTEHNPLLPVASRDRNVLIPGAGRSVLSASLSSLAHLFVCAWVLPAQQLLGRLSYFPVREVT